QVCRPPYNGGHAIFRAGRRERSPRSRHSCDRSCSEPKRALTNHTPRQRKLQCLRLSPSSVANFPPDSDQRGRWLFFETYKFHKKMLAMKNQTLTFCKSYLRNEGSNGTAGLCAGLDARPEPLQSA